MKFARIAALSLSFACASLAQAHTHMHKSVPANGAELNEAPKTLSLSFEDAVHLTAVTVESEPDKIQQVIKPLPAGDIADAVLPLPALAAGHYLVTWHAVGKDGHVTSGKIKFSIVKP